ncbi:MAG: histidine kinase dimerization/phosphoacceptor domain -containing protein, partial [Spirochaetota bacterium]
MFVAVGYVVGRLSDLRSALFSQQEELARTHTALERQLHENRTLLVEVHHRIKNNMTTVLNLLTLQATSSDSPRVTSALHDAANRVRTMVVLYDRLYRSANSEPTEVGSYLESLARAVPPAAFRCPLPKRRMTTRHSQLYN